MKKISEKWNRFLLREGKLDRESTDISREIILSFKELVSTGELHNSGMPFHWIEPQIPETLTDVADVKSIMVKVLVKNTAEATEDQEAVSVPQAHFAERKKELLIFISADKGVANTPEAMIATTSEWLPDLKNLIRHELEHARQTVKKSTGTDSGEYKGSHFGQSLRTRQSAIQYFSSPEEMEAYVSGMYKKAKTKKVPFRDIFDTWFSGIQKIIMDLEDTEVTDEDAQTAFADLKREYLAYANKRFPAAQ